MSTLFLVGVGALVAATGVAAQDRDPDAARVRSDAVLARRYLAQGIQAYRRGQFLQSTFYLRAARRLAPGEMRQSASAHKLSAFLALAEHRPARAARDLVESVARSADPFAFYLLGDHNLGLRSLRQARNSYRAAVESHLRLYARGSGEQSPALLWSRVPFACPGEELTKDWLAAYPHNDFADGGRARELWERGLHPQELALAAYQWLVLARHVDGTQSEDATRARATLGRIMSEHGATLPESVMKRVLRAPDDRESHQACLRRLVRVEQQLRSRLRAGSSNPTLLQLARLSEQQRRVYRNGIGAFGKLRDYYAYGTHQLRSGNHIEALHALRRALELANLEPKGETLSGDARAAARVLRALEILYAKVSRPKDARTVAHLARLLENHLADPGRVDEGRRREAELVMRLLRASRLYLYNREGLGLLLRHARATGNEERLGYYTERLRIRDRKYDMQEMLAAFPDF